MIKIELKAKCDHRSDIDHDLTLKTVEATDAISDFLDGLMDDLKGSMLHSLKNEGECQATLEFSAKKID